MITIYYKLYITKEVKSIVVNCVKNAVLRKPLTQFSFTIYEEKQNVSDLIVTATFIWATYRTVSNSMI